MPTRKARRAAASRTPHWLVGISQDAVSLLLTRGCAAADHTRPVHGQDFALSFLFLPGVCWAQRYEAHVLEGVEETLITVLILQPALCARLVGVQPQHTFEGKAVCLTWGLSEPKRSFEKPLLPLVWEIGFRAPTGGRMLRRSRRVNPDGNLQGGWHQDQSPSIRGTGVRRASAVCMSGRWRLCGHSSGARKETRYRGRSDAVGTTRDLVTIVRVSFGLELGRTGKVQNNVGGATGPALE